MLLANRYRLHQQLGTGAMGVVYRATDRLTGDTVALKQITLAAEHSHADESGHNHTNALHVALATEFHTLASLRHPHIISVADYGFDAQKQPFFTMDYLPDAQTILAASAGRSVAGKVALLRATLEALEYLHRRGILHCDLKPANVLVSNGRVRVLDFGLAAPLETARGHVGTPAYMAPETIRAGMISVASDLYAFGVLAYQLFAGVPPFSDLGGILYQEPDLAALAAPPELQLVIGRLLKKDPAERFPHAQAAKIRLLDAIQQPLPQEDARIRESFLQAATFVGRKGEMQQLTAALERACQGRGSTWLIGGESGVGKSRLMDELRTQALVRGALVIRGQGVEGGGLAYQLWRDVMPQLILSTAISDGEAGVLSAIVPHIGTLLERATISRPPDLPGQAGQQRLMLAINDLFRRQAQPVVLMLEDLQWAADSLVFLSELHRIAGQLALLIVGNYRYDESADVLDALPGAHRIVLERFSAAEVAELSNAMLGISSQKSEVLQLLTQETEGNAFFLVEVVRALAEEAGSLHDIGQSSLPARVLTNGMHHILQRRITRLPAEYQPLLHLAALTGRQVEERLLHYLMPEMDVEQWLYHCASAAILHVQANRWMFAHDKLRELILSELPAETRPAMHRQIAEALETIYPDDRDRAAALAHHWRWAGDAAKELHYASIAAEQALGRSAFYTALDLIDRARALLPGESTAHIPLLLQAGEALLQLGLFEQAIKRLETSLALAYAYHDAMHCSIALKHLGAIACNAGEYTRARDLLQKSLALARDVHARPQIASALLELGWVEFRQGAFVVAREHFEESVQIYEALGDRRNLSAALNRLGGAVLHLGDYAGARSLRQQSLLLSRELGDRMREAIALANLGEGERLRGNYPQARQYYLEALEIMRAIGAQYYMNINLINLGYVALACSSFDDAARYFHEALRGSLAIGAAAITLHSLTGFAGVWAQTGQETRALEVLGLLLGHPALGDEAKGMVESILKSLAAQHPADVVQRALEHGATLQVATVAAELAAA